MKLYFAGGLNEQQTPHLFECGSGYNFELGLKQSKYKPRKPFDLKATAPNKLAINGFVQLVKRDNTETTVVQAGGSVYSWDGTSGSYLNLTGAAGTYASTPDSAALDITGDIECIAYIQLNDYTTTQVIGAKFDVAGQYSYQFYVFNGGLDIAYSTNGSNTPGGGRAAPLVAGNSYWVRWAMDVDNGAGGHDLKFYYSSDPATTAPTAVSWTQAGATLTVAGTAATFSSTSNWLIGANTAGTLGNANGKIYSVYVYNGIGGTLAASFNANDGSSGAATVTSTSTAEVYTMHGAAAIVSGFTSVGTCGSTSKLRDTYWSLGDYSVITDISKATVVKKWDGTTFSTMTTGLGTDFYAKYGAVHLNRVWYANVKTSSDTPHIICASALNDPTSLSTSVVGGPVIEGGSTFSVGTPAFYLTTPNLKPVNGMVEFYGNLIISTEGGQLFRLSGVDASTFKFVPYYFGSAALGDESMANIGNDVVYMKAGGGIDRLTVTTESGDVATDDLSRFILTTTKDLTGAITIYDQKNQKVFFFVSGKVLVLFKDLLAGELSPWSVYKTAQSFAFATNAAKYMKMPGTQVYSVYFGDSAGRIFDLNGTGTGDAGSSNIAVLRKTRFIPEGEGRNQYGKGGLDLSKRVLNGIVTYRRIFASCDLTLSFDWGDEYNISSSVITLKGAPTASAGNYWGGGAYWGGTYYWSAGSAFAQKISSQSFSPTGKGPGFFLSAALDTTTDFQIDSIEL